MSAPEIIAEFCARQQDMDLVINQNRDIDPDGSIALKTYMRAYAQPAVNAKKTIEGYYAEAHAENSSYPFLQGLEHIAEKYKRPDSGIFRSDLTEAQRDIYQTVMGAYQHSGGSAVEAIRAGATYGQKLTAQATAKNPNAQRWGVSIDYYWKNFYKASDTKETSPIEHRVNKLLAQIGRTPTRNSSTYQKYMDRWRNFLTAIGGGSALNIRV